MERSEYSRRERTIRIAYELGRLRYALVFGIGAALPGMVSGLVWSSLRSILLALGAYLVYTGCLWRGQGLGQGARAGLFFSLVPFVFSHLAQPFGGCHLVGICTSWCSIACALGGFVVGGGISWLAWRSPSPGRFWAGGTGVAFLTGAPACQCTGMGSLLGMAAAILITSLPLVPKLILRRTIP